MTFARPLTCFHDGLDDLRALGFEQPRHLARDAEGRYTVDTCRDDEVDDPLQTVEVEIAAGVKGSGKNRVNTLENHRTDRLSGVNS